jgi:UDP-N-acetylmuramate dehydrogenase
VVSARAVTPGTGPAGTLDAIAAGLDGLGTRHAPLGARTTYRVGGDAGVLVEARRVEDLVALHHVLASVGAPVPVLVLGEGSNLLVADAGFPGVVVRLGAGFDTVAVGPTTVRAGGGAKLPVVARRCAAAGRHGMEWAVGVPGSVGGALKMNAGGHGADVAAVLVRFGTFDLLTGTEEEREPAALALGYRTSSLPDTSVVVWAEFSVHDGDRVAAQQAVSDIVRWRREHQPGGPNAGSVFVNPPGDSAGRLVEEAGLKGLRMGTAQVSPKHANFIQADPGGSADDVRRLVEHVRAEVARHSGVTLHPEVRMVGFPPDEPSTSPSTGGRDS